MEMEMKTNKRERKIEVQEEEKMGRECVVEQNGVRSELKTKRRA